MNKYGPGKIYSRLIKDRKWKIVKLQGWGDGSVRKGLASQDQNPEIPEPTEKIRARHVSKIPILGRHGQEDSWSSLDSQFRGSSELQVQWENLSQKIR